MRTVANIQDIVSKVAFSLIPSWRLVVHYYVPGEIYLQVEDTDARCAVTGEPITWRGRKWLLSYHMTETEIVCTAFKALAAALDHELREHFTYKGARVFDPHRSIALLVEIAGRADALDVREEPKP
ncbi:hypothetical protein [Dongia deserti]|uniref:hypothetical protein n=1 Tax=Dongia deserti TaxID=2268030 RepID=UPI000E64B69B|nr:hypothetical protein [Dongia deserti]